MIHVSAMSQRLSAPGISLLLGHGPSSPCGCLGCQGRNSSRREAIQCLNNDAVYMSVNRSLYRAMLELMERPVSAGSRGCDERPSKFRGCLHQGDAVIVAPAGLYALDGPAHPPKTRRSTVDRVRILTSLFREAFTSIKATHYLNLRRRPYMSQLRQLAPGPPALSSLASLGET